MERWQENGPVAGGRLEPGIEAPEHSGWEREKERIRDFLEPGEGHAPFGRRHASPAKQIIEIKPAPGGRTPYRRPNAVTTDFFERLRDTPSEHDLAAHSPAAEGFDRRALLRFGLPLAVIAILLPQLGLYFLGGSPQTQRTASLTVPTAGHASERSNIDSFTTASIPPGTDDTIATSRRVSGVSLITVIRGGHRMLSVRGTLEKTAKNSAEPVSLRVQIVDSRGTVVQSWDHALRDTAPAGTAGLRFSTVARDTSGRAARARVLVLENRQQ